MAILDAIRNLGRRVVTAATTPITLPALLGGEARDNTPISLKPILAHCQSPGEVALQERIIVARAYHAGHHDVRLTNRLRQFLGQDVGQFVLRLNMVRKVTKAIAERLVVEGLDAEAPDKLANAANVAFANAVWAGSRMKAKRAQLMTATVRDGESLILIDFDSESNRPRLTPHQRYTDPLVGVSRRDAGALPAQTMATAAGVMGLSTVLDAHRGDGEGMWLKYPNDDANQRPAYAVKRWTDHYYDDNGSAKTQQRINVYLDDRCEKFAQGPQGWELYPEADGTWPVPLLDKGGEPLGIPVVHVRTPEMLPAAFEAIPLQKGTNKTLVDLLASSDSSAFRILIALGWKPFDATGKPLEIAPGQWIGAVDSAAGNHPPDVKVVEGADLANQIAVLDKLIACMADAVDVPLSLMNRSNQRAAEGTLQEEKECFEAKVKDYRDTIELAIEDALKIARRWANTFGDPGVSQETDGYGLVPEQGNFCVKWAPFGKMSAAEQQAEAAGMMASGLPQEEIWAKVYGYTPEEIKQLLLLRVSDGFPDPGAAA